MTGACFRLVLRHSRLVELTPDYAATAAQIIPVLAFAALVELRALSNMAVASAVRVVDPMDRVAWGLTLALYAAFMFFAVEAEARCLAALGGQQVQAGSAAMVERTITGGLVLLLVLPVVGVAVNLTLPLVKDLLQRRR